MTEVTRWKTIATIAIAFSAGNLFATACGGDGGMMRKANAQDGQGGDDQDLSGLVSQVADLATALASTEAAVAALQDDVSDIKCALSGYEASVGGVGLKHSEVTEVNRDCGI